MDLGRCLLDCDFDRFAHTVHCTNVDLAGAFGFCFDLALGIYGRNAGVAAYVTNLGVMISRQKFLACLELKSFKGNACCIL